MLDAFREEIVKTWFGRAQKQYSGTRSGLNNGQYWADNIIYLWISFDAFTCSEFPHGVVRVRNDRFSSHYQGSYVYENMSDDFKKALIGLMQYDILDRTPNSNKPPIKVDNPNDLKKIIDAVYRVRCNLFHGGKNIDDGTEVNLIQYAFEVLYGIFEKILSDMHLI